MFKIKTIVAALITLTAATSALAADPQAGMYVSGSIGQGRVAINKGNYDAALTALGLTSIASSSKETNTGYKLQLGYQVNKNLAVEGGYISFGKNRYESTFTGGAGFLNSDVKMSGVNLSAVGIAPINNEFSLLGKLGIVHIKADVTVSSALTAATSDSEWRAIFGVGAAYNLSKNASIRAEYDFVRAGSDLGDIDSSLMSVGLAYKF